MGKNVLLDKMFGLRQESQVAGLMRFFKTGPGQYGEGDKFLGIKVPVTRKAVKECWRAVSFEDLAECMSSKYHEVRLAGLLCLVEIFSNARRAKPLSSKSFKASRKVNPLDGVSFGTAEAPNPLDNCSFDTAKETFGKDGWFMIQKRCVDFYLAHTNCINNWDLVDLSCYKLLGEWLLDKDRSVLYRLAQSGKNIWEKRIGIVSTMAFIRRGELNDTYAISDILLFQGAASASSSATSASSSATSASSSAASASSFATSASSSASSASATLHDLLQKAVGWLLREAGKKDEESLKKYLEKRACFMPRTMLRYAIERFPESERRQFLQAHPKSVSA